MKKANRSGMGRKAVAKEAPCNICEEVLILVDDVTQNYHWDYNRQLKHKKNNVMCKKCYEWILETNYSPELDTPSLNQMLRDYQKLAEELAQMPGRELEAAYYKKQYKRLRETCDLNGIKA